MGSGCKARIKCGSPDIVNFGIAPAATSTPTPATAPGWFQGKGGDVYGSEVGSAVISGEYLSTKLPAGSGYSGVVVSGGGIDSGDGGVSESSTASTEWQKTSESITGFYGGVNYGFDYFYQKFGSPVDDDSWDGRSKPAVSGVYVDDPVSQTTIDTSWSVGSGEWYVIFIDGNLRIVGASTIIDVASGVNGGFLAFIVKGNIEIQGNVTNGSNSVLKGIFIADGDIQTVAAGPIDNQFVAEGIFVADANLDGSGMFDFGRDLGEVANGTTPAEKFIYRPDFLVNLFNSPGGESLSLLRESLTWEEVVP